MEIKVSDFTTGMLLYNCVYPANFDTNKEIEEKEHQLTNFDYRINFIEHWFKGVHISVVKINTSKEMKIFVENRNQNISFLFCLEGSVYCEDVVDGKSINLKKNQQSVTIGEFSNLIINFNENVHYVYIQITQSHYKKLTGANFIDDASAFESLAIDTEVSLVLYDLVNQKNHVRIKKIFFEAQIFKLLAFYINNAHKKTSFSLKKDDIDKIMYAKQLVEENIQRPNSLIELSRKAGINDNKLKKGFKELTGETVFGYLNKIRMERAYYHLSKEKKTVSEVAFLVGYKNAQHFTVAFKKRYDILPGSLNKSRTTNPGI
ncbi:helix-turn-helix domain-containing protein [Pedobacter jamesrossensis]|uniref:Helix-turn-helix domain-containing protein n=1 Tax=Pedobacter jamesrossensis TaxID=1908238 RepID=A0ABV8NFQ9_9SPHI